MQSFKNVNFMNSFIGSVKNVNKELSVKKGKYNVIYQRLYKVFYIIFI